MINMEEILLREEETKKVLKILILEEGGLRITPLIWKMLMIYLKNFSGAEILLLGSLMMMKTFLEGTLVIQALEWWEEVWHRRKIMGLKNNKKIEMILLRNLEWGLMMKIFSAEDLVEVWWAVAWWVVTISKHSLLIVLAAWEVVWEHLSVNKL